MQEEDYADDPVLEAFLQLLAVDKSKVRAMEMLQLWATVTWLLYA